MIYQLRRAFLIPREETPFPTFHPSQQGTGQKGPQENGVLLQQSPGTGIGVCSSISSFCRDDLDICPAFVTGGMFCIPDNWK